MVMNPKILFPANSGRRLAVLFILAGTRHPWRLMQGLGRNRFSRLARLWRQREYALLEAMLALETGAPAASPSPGTVLPPEAPVRPSLVYAAEKLLVHLAIQVSRQNFSRLAATLESLRKQGQIPLQLSIVCTGGLDPEAVKALPHPLLQHPGTAVMRMATLLELAAQGTWLGFLEAGDLLAPDALPCMFAAAAPGGLPDLIYADEVQGAHGRRPQVVFKPDWSPERLLSENYIGGFFLMAAPCFPALDAARRDFSAPGLYALLLNLADQPRTVRHVPEALVARTEAVSLTQAEVQAVLEETLSRRKIFGKPEVPLRPTSWQIKYAGAEAPFVSVIIPSAFKSLPGLTACLRSLQAKTTYSRFEVLLIDNRPEASPLPGELEPFGVRHLHYPQPFNYSRLNNWAADQARGEYLVLLNDDTEVISPDWLEALLAYGQMPGMGVVGSHLLYPDGSTQHGGMVCLPDAGGARHAFRHLRQAENSSQRLMDTARNCSAVTFACVLIPLQVFRELRGLDERLAVEFNDVDFCLRAQAAGYRVVWTPGARLYHQELVTRRTTHLAADRDYFQKRWQEKLSRGDPYYNSNLSLDNDFYLPKLPVRGLAWLGRAGWL
jgi:O-antigen biosynthesis protein